MQELANGLNVNDGLLKMLFLQRMPAHIRPILTISEGALAKLAEMAETPQTAAVSMKSEANEEMQKIKEQLEVLSTEFRRFKPGPTQDIDRRRGRSSSRSRSESDVCWYHRKYGEHAERCKQPCNYNQPKN
ncbi:uncharacterized protein LOC131429112 [Malaya genurostris]|uniref:uncharacterized protein LOC131429112 n=1 Tax=Malaya genurostris TaxID=325434 RepID=UPI0026F3E200|nr:uncharacterized protein LOC131429112 [Malaya genurostris]